ncbi:MAG: hypothetical protein ACOX8Q_02705 [Christensenellales bacterium]|jgi:hypothetical protein
MEDNTIKLLYINSKIHALVNINQAPAGETGISAITQPIAANASFFITMLPLENDKNFVYLPYTRRVSIAANGAVFSNDGLIDLCVWPDNIIELTLYPEAVYKNDEQEIFPSVLSPFDFYLGGERHTAFIYNEAYSSFAVEHASSSRLKYISPLPFHVESADIMFTKLSDLPVLYAAGKTSNGETFVYALNILPTFSTAVCTACEAYQIDNNSLTVVTNGEYRQEKTVYKSTDSRLWPSYKELGWFTREEKQPATSEEACASLLQAVKANMPHAAMNCLTPSLADGLTFDDLKEFFGDFVMFTNTISPACGQNSIALKYSAGKNLYIAREFCVETKQMNGALLIDNIKEP